jgi:hypothetical protein
MPYYIYKVTPGDNPPARTLELVREYDSFRDAKREVKAMRSEQEPEAVHFFKIIFADNQPEAERRLLEHRDQPVVKEWEK